MSKNFRILLYIFVGIFSFALFLYLTFPFDVLKDRMLVNIEKNLKGKYEITVESVSPRLIAGLSLKKVKIVSRESDRAIPVFEADTVKIKASIFSLITGSPNIKYDVRFGKSRIYGRFKQGKDISHIEVVLKKVDLSKIPYLAVKYGINLKSQINGELNLDFNPRQIIRSSGSLEIEPGGIKILPSTIKLGMMGDFELKETLTIGAGGSKILAEIKRGQVKISTFKLEKGDFDLDLKGSIYLSSNVKNLRLNLKGTLKYSDTLDKVFPFLFIIEKQKSEDGTFPLTIAGRFSKPQIKIGKFTVPL